VSGCGFRPLYGKPASETSAGAIANDLATIDVPPIPDRSGQLVHNSLTRLLNPDTQQAARRYTLDVRLKETTDTLAIERSGLASRANIELTATFTLIDDTTGSPVQSGATRAISGYNLLNNDFSTYAAAEDTRRRLAQQVAMDIRNALAAHFDRQAKAASGGS